MPTTGASLWEQLEDWRMYLGSRHEPWSQHWNGDATGIQRHVSNDQGAGQLGIKPFLSIYLALAWGHGLGGSRVRIAALLATVSQIACRPTLRMSYLSI